MLRSVNDKPPYNSWQDSRVSWGTIALPDTLQSITAMWDAGADRGNDSWETALLSLSFCCGHFETSGAICLAARYAAGKRKKAFISERAGRREYARNVEKTQYLSGKKWASQTRKGGLESRSLAGKMAGEEIERTCRQVVGYNGPTRLLWCLLGHSSVLLMCSINQNAAHRTAWQLLSPLIKVSADILCISWNARTFSC